MKIDEDNPSTYPALSDVGMIMMQTGMVKHGLNSACHTYIDGTKFIFVDNYQKKSSSQIRLLHRFFFLPSYIILSFVHFFSHN